MTHVGQKAIFGKTRRLRGFLCELQGLIGLAVLGNLLEQQRGLPPGFLLGDPAGFARQDTPPGDDPDSDEGDSPSLEQRSTHQRRLCGRAG